MILTNSSVDQHLLMIQFHGFSGFFAATVSKIVTPSYNKRHTKHRDIEMI